VTGGGRDETNRRRGLTTLRRQKEWKSRGGASFRGTAFYTFASALSAGFFVRPFFPARRLERRDGYLAVFQETWTNRRLHAGDACVSVKRLPGSAGRADETQTARPDRENFTPPLRGPAHHWTPNMQVGEASNRSHVAKLPELWRSTYRI
jgi:hypothetical protein